MTAGLGCSATNLFGRKELFRNFIEAARRRAQIEELIALDAMIGRMRTADSDANGSLCDRQGHQTPVIPY